jgi:uncharacterized membrane protein YccC
MPATSDPQAAAVALGLRIVAASSLCLIVSEYFAWGPVAIAVYSAHLVMVQYTYTAFQKGVERIAGRVLGIVYALALLAFFGPSLILYFLLMAVGLMAFGYFFAASRLGYTALMAMIYLGYMGFICLRTPAEALPEGLALARQITLGVLSAFVVDWLTGAERVLTIELGAAALWPIRLDWLNRAALIAATQLAALAAAVWLEWDTLTTVVSATVLAVATDRRALETKALQRGVAALIGGVYSFLALLLLNLAPHFALLLALLALGMFASGYFARTASGYTYIGLQTGLVLPLVLLGPPGQLGSLDAAYGRLAGVALGWAVSELFVLFWPRVAPPPPVSAGSPATHTPAPRSAPHG